MIDLENLGGNANVIPFQGQQDTIRIVGLDSTTGNCFNWASKIAYETLNGINFCTNLDLYVPQGVLAVKQRIIQQLNGLNIIANEANPEQFNTALTDNRNWLWCIFMIGNGNAQGTYETHFVRRCLQGFYGRPTAGTDYVGTIRLNGNFFEGAMQAPGGITQWSQPYVHGVDDLLIDLDSIPEPTKKKITVEVTNPKLLDQRAAFRAMRAKAKAQNKGNPLSSKQPIMKEVQGEKVMHSIAQEANLFKKDNKLTKFLEDECTILL